MSGCRMPSRARFAAGSPKTRARMRARSSAPSGRTYSSPNASRMSGIAAPPGAVSACEIASVSTTSAPSSAKMSAAFDFPLPMPPVSPTRYAVFTGSVKEVSGRDLLEEVQVLAVQRFAVEERDQSRDGEVGAERNRHVAAAPREHDEQYADDSAYERRQQDHEWQHLPAEPRANRREQLEVAIAHAFLAG